MNTTTETLDRRPRRVQSATVVVVAAGMLVFAWGFWLQSSTTMSHGGREEQRGVELLPECRDFGEVWETSNFPWQLRFRNPTNRPIRIERLRSNCDCMGLPSQPMEILPGEVRTADIHLALAKQKPTLRDGHTWQVQVPLDIHWADESGKERQARWYITGKVKSLVEVQPSVVWVGDDLLRGERGSTKTVEIRPLVRCSLSGWTSPQGFECVVTAKEGGYNLCVTPTEKLPTGFFSCQVGIKLIDGEHHRLPLQTVSIYGNVNERVAVNPDSINFGVVKVGHSVEETLTVFSRSGESFEVTKIGALKNTEIVERQRNSRSESIRLRHYVEKVGQGSADGRIEVRLVSGECIELPIRLEWYGEKAAAESHR